MARSLGKVDLLGLNSFGQNPGLNPIWGTLIGGGIAGVTTIAARHSGNAKLVAYSEAVGLGAGLATSGVMYAMKSTRHAALGSLVGTFLAAGIAWVEKTFLSVASVPVVPGTGMPNIRALGIPNVNYLNGLGVPMVSERTPPAGAIPGVAGPGVAGNQINGNPGMSSPPVSLLGPMSPQAAVLLGAGGPNVHGLSAAYGATLLGGGR